VGKRLIDANELKKDLIVYRSALYQIGDKAGANAITKAMKIIKEAPTMNNEIRMTNTVMEVTK
jgi:hypothetical protein